MTVTTSQLTIPFARRTSYAADDFIVGDANRQAVEILDQFPHWPEPVIAIYGPEACGKTHLVHRMMQQYGGILLSDALGKVDAANLVAQAPLLVVDGWENEAALAQLINHCRAVRHPLLITSREPPARVTTHTADLHSRLSAVIALEMRAPDETLLTALLTKHFADQQIRVAPEVITYIVSRMERSYNHAARAAAWLDAKALEAGRAVTLPLARQWLEHEKQ